MDFDPQIAWQSVRETLAHTPPSIYVLFGYLVWRGVKARRAAAVRLWRLALIPVLFTLMGLVNLATLHGLRVETLALWLLALGVGAALGLWMLRATVLVPDRAHGLLHRPADFTVLPLILLAFAVKYAFGVMQGTAPALLQTPLYASLDILTSGFFAGVFVGKFVRYWRGYFG